MYIRINTVQSQTFFIIGKNQREEIGKKESNFFVKSEVVQSNLSN